MAGDGWEVWRRWGNIFGVGSDIYWAMVGGKDWRWIVSGRYICLAGVVVAVLPWFWLEYIYCFLVVGSCFELGVCWANVADTIRWGSRVWCRS